jgi:hypothetical protein
LVALAPGRDAMICRELPAIRIGTRLRVPIAALEHILAEAGTDLSA